MSTNGAVLEVKPIHAARVAFQDAVKSNDFPKVASIISTSKSKLIPKDLSLALLTGTQKNNTPMVSYFLEQCSEEITFEDLLSAFEIAILINDPGTLASFSSHFSKGSSPRTPKQSKEHIDTLNALKIANGDLALLQDSKLSPFSLRKALWVTGQAGNEARFAHILKNSRLTIQDKALALEKIVAAQQAKIVNILLETSKADIDEVSLGLALEAAAKNSDLATIKILYQHCKTAIPANSIGMALEKCIDNDKYNPKILHFILQESSSLIKEHFIEAALQAAILRDKVDAVEQIFALKNTGPEQRKQAFIVAINAKKQDFFNDPRFKLAERILAVETIEQSCVSSKTTLRPEIQDLVTQIKQDNTKLFYDPRRPLKERIEAAGGISAYLLKFSKDFRKAHPIATLAAALVGRLMMAIYKAWKNEPAPHPTKKESHPAPAPAQTPPVGTQENASTLIFSAPSASALKSPPDTTEAAKPKTKNRVGFEKSVKAGVQ